MQKIIYPLVVNSPNSETKTVVETVHWEIFKHESLQILSSLLGNLADHGAISCISMLWYPSTHSPRAQLQALVLALLASGWETLDHFAITSEIYMLFWTLLHTFPCHYFEKAYGSSWQARKNEILLLPSVFGLGWLCIADSMLPVCLARFDYYTHLNLLHGLLLKLQGEVFRIWKNRLKAKHISDFNYQYTVFCVTF